MNNRRGMGGALLAMAMLSGTALSSGSGRAWGGSGYVPSLPRGYVAHHTPDQRRKPRGVNRAAKRLAQRKAIAWRGGR